MKRSADSGKKIFIVDPVGKKAGLDYYNDSLASSLADLNYQVKILSNYNSKFAKPIFKFHFGRSLLFIPGFIFSYLRTYQYIRSNKPDVIIFHMFKADKFHFWLLKKVKKLKIRIVYVLHDIENLLSLSDNADLMMSCLKLSDQIVVHNQFSSTTLAEKYPSQQEKVCIIPHGNFRNLPSDASKEEARQELGLNDMKNKVLFFGMIKSSKGLQLLLQAMENIDAELIVAGRMRKHSIADYRKGITSLKRAGKLYTDIDYISNEKRDLYFKAADILVLPYRKIYQSGVLLMAMSYGLPIISSDLLPVVEFVGESDCVEFFKDGDISDLEEKIDKLLKNENRCRILKGNAYIKIDSEHNWKLIGEKFNLLLTK